MLQTKTQVESVKYLTASGNVDVLLVKTIAETETNEIVASQTIAISVSQGDTEQLTAVLGENAFPILNLWQQFEANKEKDLLQDENL